MLIADTEGKLHELLEKVVKKSRKKGLTIKETEHIEQEEQPRMLAMNLRCQN